MNSANTHPPDCGCCEGLTYRTPVAPVIRPGLSAISHRIGTHDHFFYSLLTGMAQDDNLSRLRTRERNDPTIALCDAVATLLDVLSFYQERFLNEAYLRTATETFSLHQLARQIAYVPAPAVAAAAYLAFTAEEIPGGDVDIRIPAGTRVQSVPGQDEAPQIFETDETITAQVAWNDLRPRQTIPYPPDEGASDIYVAGIDSGLMKGDRLLFVGPERRDDSTSDQWLLATVRKVEPDNTQLRSHVTFDPPLEAPLAQAGFDLYGMRAKAAIYGHNAAEWRTLPETTMKAYLGIPEDAELTEAEKEEWPDYTVLAPHGTLVQSAIPFSLDEPPTLDHVLKTANDALSTSARSSIRQFVTAVPDTLTQQVKVVTSATALAQVTAETALPALVTALRDSIGSTLTTIADGFTGMADGITGLNPVSAMQHEDDSSDDSGIPTSWNDLIKKVAGGLEVMPSDLGLDGPVRTLAETLGTLATDNPLAALLETIIELLTPPVADPHATDDDAAAEPSIPETLLSLGQEAKTALDTLNELPKYLEAAAATQLMTAAVGATVNLLRSQSDLLNLSPKKLAMGAMTAARLTEFWLEYYDPDLNEWIADIPAPPNALEPDDGSGDDTGGADMTPLNLMGGPHKFRDMILEDLQLPTHEDFDIQDALMPLIQEVRQIFPGLNALQKAVEPYLTRMSEVVEDGVEDGLRFLESGVGRGAVNTRRHLARHLAKAIRPQPVAQPLRRAFPTRHTDRIDLERVYPEISPGDDGWTVLSAGDSQRLYQVSAAGDAARSDYILNAKTTRLTLEGPDLAALFEDKVRQTVVHAGSRLLTVVEGPLTTPVAGDRIQMEAAAPANGFIPPRKVAVSGVSNADDAVQSEIAEVIAVTGADPPTWYLAADLRHSYRRDSVRINANVAAASHGESQVEILGDGDGGSAFQSFILKQRPLTHKPGQGDKRFASTLSLRVNDIEWQAVPHFLENEPQDEVYTTLIDEEETVSVSFGDGRTGRRLPTGTNNVVARYRKGAGLGGNLRAHQLTALASRPLGVGAVDNPAPASGGADGETLADLRHNLPKALLTFDRIVSLGDFEAYAAAYPGIGKAHATWIWDGVRQRVYVSVVAADGTPVDGAGPLMDNLKTVMDRVRDPQQPLTIASSAPVGFHLTTKLLIEQGHDFEVVAPAVVEALTTAFNFNAARYNQGIRRSVVIAAIQAVGGVAALDLDLLAREDGLQTARGDLPVRPVARNDGSLQPAELLVIDPERIVVSRMTVQHGG